MENSSRARRPVAPEKVATLLRQIFDASDKDHVEVPYDKFYEICQRRQIRDVVYDEIHDFAREEENLIVGFGRYRIILSEDELGR